MQGITVEPLPADAKKVVYPFCGECCQYVGIEIIAKVAKKLLRIADMRFDGTWLQAADVSQIVRKTVHFGQ